MPKTEPASSVFNVASLLWGAITLTAIGMSQPIWHAWFHDPTLRFAFASFLLWLLATLLQWRRFPMIWPWPKTLLVVLASGLLFLGIAGELQAFIYLAVGILFVLPIHGALFKCLCFILLSSLWMPALAWLLFPYMGSFLPWSTLLIAILLLIYSLTEHFFRYASKTSHTSI
ncbi:MULTISPECIES: hypothetical protein [unclassified Lentimonas]|uniref:hypothetical protein n=1 Tax=unclassified Lentimonas TaxID=2630993 RepID=UPI00132A1ECC|nr:MULTISPECIES: hypothetical protein [unclassified Lentimonas]CAA6684843.1 Unannotated [Lentimonas sp. CC6]CAA7170800.1 Unannotated [Lentimonas sp. CC21]CAA6678261.1 Unannotated [Lentimonas sp. CC4]CAA7076802.1 Unannotated [Lentimonas sp. CC4]CAA7179638.1 Unannotated [Lentimonas sp. CC8]